MKNPLFHVVMVGLLLMELVGGIWAVADGQQGLGFLSFLFELLAISTYALAIKIGRIK